MITLAEKKNEKVTEASENVEGTKKPNKKATAKSAELEQLKEELQKQKELLLRTAAEFDNYKRRTERESIAAAEYTKAQMLKKLLPIFDNVDRANAADKDSVDYAKGVELTVKMLNEAVTNLGLVEIGKVGEPFNPEFHEEVMHIEDDTLGENVISQVLQKGYKIGDTVIRPAMVQVAN